MTDGDPRTAVFQEPDRTDVNPPGATWIDVRVKGWGANGSWQLGDGSSATDRRTPATMPGLTGAYITSLSTGGSSQTTGFGLALLSNGTVDAWGYNGNNQLGDGTTSNRAMPGTVHGLENVVGIAGGGLHSLALLRDGTVLAWGYNGYGQLGDGTTTPRPTPVPVRDLDGVTAIAAGGNHSLALRNDGTVRAWGANDSGQLGDGTGTNRPTPVRVRDITGVLTGVQRIAAGSYHSLAVMADHTVRAWGRNGYGQLGDDTITNRSTPVATVHLDGVTEIIAGGYHSVALVSNGTLRTWGWNAYGQLGDGTNLDHPVPVAVSGSLAADITAMAAGNYHTLALRRDGIVLGWGNNSNGQLGDGTATNRTTPVYVVKENGYPRKMIAAAAGGYHSYAV